MAKAFHPIAKHFGKMRSSFESLSTICLPKNWFQSQKVSRWPPLDSAPWLRVGISTCQEVGGDMPYLDSKYPTVSLDIIWGQSKRTKIIRASGTGRRADGRLFDWRSLLPWAAAASLPPHASVLQGPFVKGFWCDTGMRSVIIAAEIMMAIVLLTAGCKISMFLYMKNDDIIMTV